MSGTKLGIEGGCSDGGEKGDGSDSGSGDGGGDDEDGAGGAQGCLGRKNRPGVARRSALSASVTPRVFLQGACRLRRRSLSFVKLEGDCLIVTSTITGADP